MREIKFRGKAIASIEELELMNIKHNNGWVYGNLIKNGNRPIISEDILEEIDESIYPEWWAVVEPESVGQYTGVKDENGKEIYEGDIIKCFNSGNSYVSFKGGVFGLISDYGFIPFSDVHGKMRVIGNIYENPELLDDSE